MADGIMTDIDFRIDPRWASAYDRSEPAMLEKFKAAEKSKSFAELLAPVLSGDYKRAFVVVKHRSDILLGNTDYKANWIEFGTLGSPELNIPPWPAHATLRRATGMAGYR